MKQQANQSLTKNVDVVVAAVADACVGSGVVCVIVVVDVVDIVVGIVVAVVVVIVDVVVEYGAGVVKHSFYVQHIKSPAFP